MRIFSTFALLLIFAAVSRAQTISLVNTGAVGNARPPISEDGQVVYQNNAPATALYLGKPGTPIQMVVATNGPISGSPSYSFNGLIGRRIANGTNQIAFYESRTAENISGLFANFSGTLYRVAVISNQVPGLSAGVLFNTGDNVSGDVLPQGFTMNSNGVFVFNAKLMGTGINTTNNHIVMKGHPTNLTVIARSGSPAPGFPSGWVFQTDAIGGGINEHTFINGSGRAVFIAEVNHTNNIDVSTNCIWFHDAAGLRPVVTFDINFPPASTPAPDAGTSARFRQLHYVTCLLNDSGEIAFYALAVTPSFTLTTGIWSGPTNNLHLVIAYGMAAPGIGGGATISDLDFNRFYLGNTGAVAVIANLAIGGGVTSTNDTVLYIGSRTNNVQLIARKGMQAPGCPAGVYFTSLNNSDVSNPVIFGNNRVAFGGKLAGAGVTGGNNLGLWATDTSGTLQLVFRTGETLLEVQPGVFRTINTFFYNGGTGQDGRTASINRKGQLSMDVSINGVPDLSGNYVLDLNGVGSIGGTGTSSFGASQYFSGTGFQLNLNLETGKSYRLQRNTDLTTTNWVTLTNFTSTSSSLQYLDSSAPYPLGVYRVVSP